MHFLKLYEESQIENESLRGKLRRTEEELAQTKAACEKNALLVSIDNIITERLALCSKCAYSTEKYLLHYFLYISNVVVNNNMCC